MFNGCKDNTENSSTTKVGKHIQSGFSMSTISLFKIIENKHDVYRGKHCMKKFCESLREHAIEITNSNKHDKHAKDKKYRKVRDHCHYIL